MYTDFFPPVFDIKEEPQNETLKLARVSSTESNKPLKLNDNTNTDSENSEKSSIAEDEGKTDLNIVYEV